MQPYIGQIIMFAGNYAPRGWALCNGQLLPIAQNTVLFAILGTTYGGDGRTNFALPDLRDRLVMHAGQTVGQTQGQVAGRVPCTLGGVGVIPTPAPGRSSPGHPVTPPVESTSNPGYLGINFIIALEGDFPPLP